MQLCSMSSVQVHREKISNCPREKSWTAFDELIQYEGFWNYAGFVEKIMEVQENFEASSTDKLLASHMKTGTTWLKALAYAIATRNTFSSSPLLTNNPHDCIPHLEIDLLKKDTNNHRREHPLIGTHISYTSLPKSIQESSCKIVYIWRDAKDVFVSFWYFVYKIHKSCNFLEPIPIDEAFEQFCQGVSPYGPYWDHVLGYWKAKLEYPNNVLFLKYEEMKEDSRFYVKQLAEFMGYPFSLEEEENGVVEKIIATCSFDNLSNLEVNKTGTYQPDTPLAFNNDIFFRKGEIGDWKNVLTPEMGARLDSIMDQKLNATGLLR